MNRRGITLLEMLVVVAVLAPITLSVMTALGQARQSRSNSARTLSALIVAQQELDAARLSLTSTPGGDQLTTATTRLRTGDSAVLSLRRTSRADNLTELEVEVSFPDLDTGLAPVRLTTVAVPTREVNP